VAMQFSKDDLYEKISEPVIEEEIDRRRWCNRYRCVFEHEGRHYETYYDRGTGDYGERPYEHESDPIECEEVFPVEIRSIVYMTANQIEKRKTDEA
jgi:hypothetical protein